MILLKLKFLLCILLSFSTVMTGCNSKQVSYVVWVDSSTSSQETIDSAIERLSDAEVDFIIDDNGSVLVNEKDMDKAVICCS